MSRTRPLSPGWEVIEAESGEPFAHVSMSPADQVTASDNRLDTPGEIPGAPPTMRYHQA